MKVVWVSTHYNNTIGYSKVTYAILSTLVKNPDIKLYHFGYRQHMTYRRQPIKGVSCYVGCQTEIQQGQLGFGEDKLPKYLDIVKPDLVIIYDESINVAVICDKCIPEKRKYKLWVYLDQNYKHSNLVGINPDRYLIFSEQWKIDTTIPQTVLLHAPTVTKLDEDKKLLIRESLGIKPDETIFLSINRNSVRKRLDLLLQAWGMYKRKGNEGRLLIHTKLDGYYNLKVIGHLENVPMESVLISNNDVTDDYINNLLNISDYGVNTSDGEGFGLMSLEMAYLGKPQVVLDIGSHRAYLNDDTSVILSPKLRIHRSYNDKMGAYCETTYPDDFASGFEIVKTKQKPVINFTWDSVLNEVINLIVKCN